VRELTTHSNERERALAIAIQVLRGRPLVVESSRMPTPPEFLSVFEVLREILQRQAGRLAVSEDSATRYCLQGGSHPKHKTPMPVAWVEIGKAYVSFHHMGVYARPDLLKSVSKELRARMQGKSCFNFKVVDQQLFAQLEELSARAFDAFRSTGFMQ
jgi:hypothetical protein